MGWFLGSILAAYALALAVPRPRGHRGAVVGWLCMPALLLCPLLIPPAHVRLRAASSFVAGDLAFKVIEAARHPGMPLRTYGRFLIPFPVLSIVYPDLKRRLKGPRSPWPEVARLAGGIAGCLVAVLVLLASSRLDAIRSSFALNHAVMLVAFVVEIESLSRAICAIERLAGYDTRPIIRNAYLSRTIAEFWRRYNARVHRWMTLHGFRPAGGRHAPALAVVLVFLVSGLYHELAFTVATSRLTGYQFAFFAIQAPAVLASGPLDRLARSGGVAGKAFAHAVAIAFLAATSVLFFDGVRRIFPFLYVARSPLT